MELLDVTATPDVHAIPVIGDLLQRLINFALGIGMEAILLGFIGGAIAWGIGHHFEGGMLAHRGKRAMLAATGAAIVMGVAVSWINGSGHVGASVR